jgi:hypothetical protein
MLSASASVYYVMKTIDALVKEPPDPLLEPIADQLALDPFIGTLFRRMLTNHIRVALESVVIRSIIYSTQGAWMDTNRMFAQLVEQYIFNAVANAGTGRPLLEEAIPLSANAVSPLTAAQLIRAGLDSIPGWDDLKKILDDFIETMTNRPNTAQDVPRVATNPIDGLNAAKTDAERMSLYKSYIDVMDVMVEDAAEDGWKVGEGVKFALNFIDEYGRNELSLTNVAALRAFRSQSFLTDRTITNFFKLPMVQNNIFIGWLVSNPGVLRASEVFVNALMSFNIVLKENKQKWGGRDGL